MTKHPLGKGLLDQSFLWRRFQYFAGRIAEHLLGARRVSAAGRPGFLDLADEHERADQQHHYHQAAAADHQQKEQIELFASGCGPRGNEKWLENTVWIVEGRERESESSNFQNLHLTEFALVTVGTLTKKTVWRLRIRML